MLGSEEGVSYSKVNGIEAVLPTKYLNQLTWESDYQSIEKQIGSGQITAARLLLGGFVIEPRLGNNTRSLYQTFFTCPKVQNPVPVQPECLINLVVKDQLVTCRPHISPKGA